MDFVNDWHIEKFANNKLGKDYFLGKSVHELPGLVNAGVDTEVARIFKGESIEFQEVYFPEFAVGGSGWVSIRAVPIHQDDLVAGGILIRENITVRKKIEAALQKSQQKFMSLVENADDIIYSQAPDGYLIYLSPRFTELLGHEVQDYIGRHVADLVHPEDYLLAQRHLRDLLKTGQRQSKIEVRLLHKDGGWRWFMTNISPQSYAHGKIESIMGIAHDITERKEAEEKLRKSEERFSLAMQATRDGLWDWDITTGEAYFSPGYAKMLGYESPELPADVQLWLDLIHPDDKHKAYQANKDCIDNLVDSFAAEFRMKAKSGDWVWILGRGSAVQRDESGKALRMIGTHTEITERKQAEEELRYQKQLLETIINGTWDILSIKQPDHTIERYNQAGYDLLGMPPEEVNGRKCFELLGRTQTCSICPSKMVLEKNDSASLEKFVPELGVYLDCRISPVFDDEGNIIKIVQHLRDITERKQMEEKLKKMSFYDFLTGLYNRNFFDEEMARIADGRYSPVGEDAAQGKHPQCYYTNPD